MFVELTIYIKRLVSSIAICCLFVVSSMDAGEQPGAGLPVSTEVDPVKQTTATERLDLDQPIRSNLVARYKNGFLLETIASQEMPFQLKVNGRMQGCYTGFASGETGQVGTLFRLQYQVAF